MYNRSQSSLETIAGELQSKPEMPAICHAGFRGVLFELPKYISHSLLSKVSIKRKKRWYCSLRIKQEKFVEAEMTLRE